MTQTIYIWRFGSEWPTPVQTEM